ncbi:DUF2232 domain-containing protein [Megasphaera vaginalis (ex Bordigoni et al. 2020)]|uniref:DUF2232 domain-containing protein n=2 Tax=Megasphaera TaxID=906 RepID=UPI000C7A2B89|nr:DUF2232 domain-containing protein [Megasphaera vaginalis (ex Bordigoni et al. 2020)]
MDDMNVKAMTTAGLLAVIMVFLGVLGYVSPLFALIGYFVFPVPMIIVFLKFGAKWAALFALAAGLLLALFISPLFALIMFLSFGIMGTAIGCGLRRQWPLGRLIALAAGALLVLTVLLSLLTYAVNGVNVIAVTTDAWRQTFDLALASYSSRGLSPEEALALQEQVDAIKETSAVLLPAAAVVSMFILAYVYIKAAVIILQRLHLPVRPLLPIRYWEIPRIMVYLYVLAQVMRYWGSTRSVEWLNLTGVGLSLVSFFFISIEGIAFFLFLAERKFHLKSTGQGMILAAYCLFLPLLQNAAFIGGIVEMLLQYRKKHGGL